MSERSELALKGLLDLTPEEVRCLPVAYIDMDRLVEIRTIGEQDSTQAIALLDRMTVERVLDILHKARVAIQQKNK